MNKHTWSIADAKEVYNIERWSDGYFNINQDGDLVARPVAARPDLELAFTDLIKDIEKKGLSFPVLVRFSDILANRLEKLENAFAKAKDKHDYQGQYNPVYPIKVNQQRKVVEKILSATSNCGLEVGTKPELMAAIFLLESYNALLICNGYKDAEYIKLALIAQKLNNKVLIIVEKLSEVKLIIEQAKALDITPILGVRLRLSSLNGNWQNTGGEKSKFGLTASQVLQLIDQLNQHDALDWLEAIHVHFGSQIADLDDVRKGMQECACYYSQLSKLGLKIKTIDVGGGLSIDYEGSNSKSWCSANYSIDEYAEVVVQTLATVSKSLATPAPDIVTESGRAMTAHHAMLITQVIDKEEVNCTADSVSQGGNPQVIQSVWQLYQAVDAGNSIDCFNQINELLQVGQHQFLDGTLALNDKAQLENLYYATCNKIKGFLNSEDKDHQQALDSVNQKLATKLFCNFSLFQSLPDVWALDQIFPVMPLTGLANQPEQRVIIKDITCDSDGRIDLYVDGNGIKNTLVFPSSFVDPKLFIGFFLIGAYQETLGDTHNLFGDTDSVHVEYDGENGFVLTNPLLGDKVDKILEHVHFDPHKLLQSYKMQLEHTDLTSAERKNLLSTLISGLSGYTYLEYNK